MTRKTAFVFLIVTAAVAVTGCAAPSQGERPAVTTTSGLSACAQPSLSQWSTDSVGQSQASTPSLAQPPHDLHQSGNFASLVYLAAQTLADRAENLNKARPVVVTTIVSVDDLARSSTFGRLASQMIANRIEQRGFLVRDVTYTRALTLAPETGELVLSREAARASAAIHAQAVVAGTYAVAGEMIYLSLRLISADNGELLSSVDVAVPRNCNTNPLIETVGEATLPLDAFEAKVSKRGVK